MIDFGNVQCDYFQFDLLRRFSTNVRYSFIEYAAGMPIEVKFHQLLTVIEASTWILKRIIHNIVNIHVSTQRWLRPSVDAH